MGVIRIPPAKSELRLERLVFSQDGDLRLPTLSSYCRPTYATLERFEHLIHG